MDEIPQIEEILQQQLRSAYNTAYQRDPVEVEILRKEISYTESIGAYGTLGILALEHDRVAVKYLVLVTGCQAVGKIKDTEIFRLTQTCFVPLSSKAPMELVADVGKLLASGKFYFGHPSFGANFDLLSCAQKQGVEQSHFYWNKSLLAYLQRFGVDVSKWVFRAMCGHVAISMVYSGDKQAKLCLFSRLSCERAGTRFNVRGINDDGHVANFVETEEAIYVDDSVASFVQVRGLVPLFWDQPGIQTVGGMTRIKFSRGYTCSHPAFERHFEWCLLYYGPTLCLNLLGSRDMERMLTGSFQEHFSQLSTAYCAELTNFDYHRMIKSGNSIESTLAQALLPDIIDFRRKHSFYVCTDGHASKEQTATIRTNCLDCLDRTNSVQGFLGQQVLSELMASLGLSTKQQLQSAWTQNGDSLSRLYTGTRALKFEGKNKLKDGARSVQRTIRSNFMDSNKQEAIDVLLLSNACQGELSIQSQSLLDKSDLLENDVQ